MHMEVTG